MDLEPDRNAVRQQLARLLSSPSFQRAERSSSFLRYLVETTLEGRSERLKEYTIGAEALDRGDSFDPRTDPIVRAEASRLRARLERYYETEGRGDLLIISLPKGGYVPQFVPQQIVTESPAGTVRSFHTNRSAWIAVAGLLGGCVLAALAYIRISGSNSENRFQQFDVELKSDGVLGSEVSTDMVLSADGSRILFVSRERGGIAHL